MVKFLQGVAFGLVLIAAQAAMAHTGATGVVKERMDLFKEMGKGMKPIAGMMKGRQDFDSAVIVNYSQLLVANAEKLPHKFPEGSLRAPSEALPAVWDDKARFLKLFEKLSLEATKLGEIAATGDEDAVFAQVKATGKVCGQCHDKFRED